ncbi:M48 family metalloprotease, partial [Candidatus Saccharibacteria bacterium]|nr:M48 family metalloprotease [Candidatus Saccharibacteria bacterium]
GEYRDPELKEYLEGVMRRLWASSERPHLPLEFYVQNTSIPNAFALPGHVAITRGLLAELENEAQFAAIMGHEMGHVMARHTAQRLTRASLMQIGLVAGGAAIEGSGGDLLTQAGAIGGTLLLLKFGRDQELQADRLSVRYISRLGYDPYEVVRAHERLQIAVEEYIRRTGEERRGESKLGALLSTHPRDEVRKDEIIDMIRSLPSYNLEGDGKHADVFLAKTDKLRKIHMDYIPYDRAQKLYSEEKLAEAEQVLADAIRNNPEQAPFYNLFGMIKLKQERFAEAERHFETALALDPKLQPSIFGLGAALFKQERYSLAVSEFQKSLELYPGHLGSVFGLGASYFELKRYRQAIPPLKEVASAVPGHLEIHGMLGISYEAVGESRSAYDEYVLQLRVAPNNEYGRYAQSRLLVLSPTQQPLPLR